MLALSLLSATSLRRHLTDGREAMTRGKTELLAGDAGAADRSFTEAGRSFAEAARGVGAPWLRVARWLPFIGRTPDAVAAIADAGARTAEAGHVLARAVADLPGGLAALAPSEGRIRIALIPPLSSAVAEADALTGRGLVTLERAPQTLLIGPVSDARRLAEEQLRSLHDALRSAALILEGLPRFLGADGPRTYFFGAENPAELRGTGGLLGAYSLLTIEDGRFLFSDFLPIQHLPQLGVEEVEPPNPDYARNYDQFRGGGRFWSAINVMPDFPSAAVAIRNAYREATGVLLDGVVTADPFALAALLEVTGPAEVPGLDFRVNADNVVDFTTNGAYSLFPDPATRKLVLGTVAEGVFERFVNDSNPTIARLKTLARAAAEGHIHVYSADPTMQEGLAGTGVGGALRSGPGDFFSVIVNSAAGDKVDYFQERTVTYTVLLLDGGRAEAGAGIRLENHAPTSGEPRYVIGPILKRLEAGDSVTLLNVYCGPGCRLRDAERNGREVEVGSGTDLGHPFFQDYFKVPSGRSADLALSWSLSDAWEGNSSGGTYRLTILSQTPVRPIDLRVEVRAPEGMRVVRMSDPMRLEGDAAVWEGNPARRLELEVAFRPPLLVRLWRDFTRFLSRPVIRL
ncbi:MAG: DUF4012 domain-containing protein [Actinobacteria bacterium]|nr:DUF4012 domain-containing protein [Actinomycetota bacterium]